jgi:hypothetical protein
MVGIEPVKKQQALQAYLLEHLQTVTEAEGFSVTELGKQFKEYYTSVDRTQGDRCVDGRTPKKVDGYDFADGSFNGRQFAGGTFGIIGALRSTTDRNEDEARAFVKRVYEKNGWRIGDHIDDDHGSINDTEILKTRNMGCGNQDKIREGAIPMYAEGQVGVTPEEVDDRFTWLRKINGYLPVLKGEHEEKGAAVNLFLGKTFNTEKAVEQNKSIFNLDLAEAHYIAQTFYKEMESNSDGAGAKDQFVQDFINAVIRDYLQTLAALTEGREIQYYAETV